MLQDPDKIEAACLEAYEVQRRMTAVAGTRSVQVLLHRDGTAGGCLAGPRSKSPSASFSKAQDEVVREITNPESKALRSNILLRCQEETEQ